MMRLVSRVFIVAGLAMLGWCVYVWIDATAAQRTARQSLELAAPTPPASPLTSAAS